MRQFVWASVGLSLVIAGCQESQQAIPAAKPAAKAKAQSESTLTARSGVASDDAAIRSGDFLIGEPVRFKNLSVFPVLSKFVKDADRFLTLDEGLKAALVEVTEVGAQPGRQAVDEAPDENDPFGDDLLAEVGDVNRVMVLNKSDRPLYLMPGEIIVGGKQDRCIAAETIVEADGKLVAVEVYCVEHGRWHRLDVADFAAVAGAFAEDVSDDSIARLSQQRGRQVRGQRRQSEQTGPIQRPGRERADEAMMNNLY